MTEPWVAISFGRPLAEEPALAGVGALGVLPDDDHVDVVGALAGQGRRGAGEEADGPEVDVEVELEAQPQEQPPLEDAGRDVGRAHRAEEDGVEPAQLVEDGVGQHLAGAQVAGAAEVVLDRVEADAGRGQRLAGLGDDLRADAVPGEDADLVGH